MPPLTERVELRLDVETIERIDAWRMRQDDGLSRSEAVRRLIEAGFKDDSSTNFRMDGPSKLITWMLAEVLKNQIKTKADPHDGDADMDTVDLVQQSIYGGHHWALGLQMTGVLHNHVDDPRNLYTVLEIMSMWDAVERAYRGFPEQARKQIEEAVGALGRDPKFMGFDGNNESEFMGIASFLVKHLDRFEDFKGRSFNAHAPTLGRYTRMAEAFASIQGELIGRAMSVQEVIRILKSASRENAST